jgi:hypothetical protein
MIPKLADYLNQTVLVSIPVLHSDGKCRSYTLLGVEMQGLWLQDEDLVEHLASVATDASISTTAPVFVPFSHIAFVVLPAPVTRVSGFEAIKGPPPQPDEPAARSGAHRDTQAHRPKKKSGK